MEELERRIMEVLADKEKDFEEIARELGISGREMRTLRKALSDLIRKGKVTKEPDYDKRRFVFKINRNNV